MLEGVLHPVTDPYSARGVVVLEGVLHPVTDLAQHDGW